MFKSIFSAVAGALRFFEFLFSSLIASFNAIKTESASIRGGSPTAFDLFTTFSLLFPFSYILTLNISGKSLYVRIL